MDTTNWQMVGRQGDLIVVVMPNSRMSKEEALVHAAWLVLLADPEQLAFQSVFDEVRSER